MPNQERLVHHLRERDLIVDDEGELAVHGCQPAEPYGEYRAEGHGERSVYVAARERPEGSCVENERTVRNRLVEGNGFERRGRDDVAAQARTGPVDGPHPGEVAGNGREGGWEPRCELLLVFDAQQCIGPPFLSKR